MAILILHKFLNSKNIFGVSLANRNYSGALMALDYIIYIMPATIILNLYPIQDIWVAFKVREEVIFNSTLIIILSYILFIVMLGAISKISPK